MQLRRFTVFWVNQYSIHLYICIDLTMLLYTFLLILIDTKNKQFVLFHLINFLSYCRLLLVQELLVIFEAFACVNILSLEWLGFKMPAPLDFNENNLLSKASRIFSLFSQFIQVFKNNFFFLLLLLLLFFGGFFYSLVSNFS